MARRPLSVRLDEALVAEVKAEADRRGQKVTTFVERALRSALDFEKVRQMDQELGSIKDVERGTKNVKPKTPSVASTWRR